MSVDVILVKIEEESRKILIFKETAVGFSNRCVCMRERERRADTYRSQRCWIPVYMWGWACVYLDVEVRGQPVLFYLYVDSRVKLRLSEAIGAERTIL